MADRGWLGFSRRWWGSEQLPARPLEVIRVGADESDGGSLNVGVADQAPAAGQRSRVFLDTREADVFVEQIMAERFAGPEDVAVAITPGLGFASLFVNPVLRVCATRIDSYTVAVPPTLEPAGPFLRSGEVYRFEPPGLLVPAGSALQLEHGANGERLRAWFAFREAA